MAEFYEKHLVCLLSRWCRSERQQTYSISSINRDSTVLSLNFIYINQITTEKWFKQFLELYNIFHSTILPIYFGIWTVENNWRKKKQDATKHTSDKKRRNTAKIKNFWTCKWVIFIIYLNILYSFTFLFIIFCTLSVFYRSCLTFFLRRIADDVIKSDFLFHGFLPTLLGESAICKQGSAQKTQKWPSAHDWQLS